MDSAMIDVQVPCVVSEDCIRLIPLDQGFDPLGDVEQRNRIQPIIRKVVKVNRSRAHDLASFVGGFAAVVQSALLGIVHPPPCAHAIS
ncbi:hypothetical protein BA900_03835 [Spiribacter roseus]|nr:hypothetical protein BA900_03835 [Spiribacter roseus]